MNGEVEGRKGNLSLLPTPSPFQFFCLPSLQLSRKNSIGNGCYAGFSPPQRPVFRRSLARSLSHACSRVLSSHDRPLFAAFPLLLRDIPDLLPAVVRRKRENRGSFVRNSFHVKGLTRKADSMRRMIVRRTNKKNLGGMKDVEGTTSCC